MSRLGRKEAAYLADHLENGDAVLWGYLEERCFLGVDADPFRRIVLESRIFSLYNAAVGEEGYSETEGWFDPRIRDIRQRRRPPKDPNELIRLLKARRKWELKWWGATNLPARITKRNLKQAMRTKRIHISNRIERFGA